MGLIFDLDQTLIDSSIAEKPRESRDWPKALSLIPLFVIYPGINEVLAFIYEKEIPIVVVTSSPSHYCNKTLSHWKIKVTGTVCYHDTSRRKPHPDPIIKAISYFPSNHSSIFSFGDRDIDIIASNSANINSVACLWGTSNKNSLLASNPKFVLNQPSDILTLIKNQF